MTKEVPADTYAKLHATIAAFPGKGFAVVDGAHFEDISTLLRRERLFARSLFLDTADIEVQKAGPWLIALAQAPEATDTVLALVGEKPAAVFWCCDAGETVLYRHLRTLNMARIPFWAANGESVPPTDAEPLDRHETAMFRHWDPRVVGALLPTFDAAQLARVLGPSEEIAFEAPDFGGVRRCIVDKSWPAAARGPLTVRSDQIVALNGRRTMVSHRRIAFYLRDVAANETSLLDDNALMALVVESDRSGRDLGIKSEQAHARWAYVMVRTKGRALEQPGLREYMTDGRVTPDEKTSWLLKTIAAMEARVAGDA